MTAVDSMQIHKVHSSIWHFIFLRSPPAAVGHKETVQREAERAAKAAKKTSDVIREFIHDINADRQRGIAERGE